MIDRLKRAVSDALGSPVRTLARTSGGDINDAYTATLADGRDVFVKTHANADPRMFACEAHGLDWLRDARAIRIPRVLAYSAIDDQAAGASVVDRDGVSFLVLERIASSRRAPDFDERLGRELAALHRAGASSFGFTESNFIGSLPQDNSPCHTWSAFYVTRRLEPQVRAAIDRGHAPATWHRAFDRLFSRMEAIAGPPEPPARLHGDLWGGNVMSDEAGAPCLIDPAVYGGHREIDLAMLRLFGGVGPRAFAAYEEAMPLAEGHADRVALYQLYPLLVHVNLFGGGYASSVEHALRRYV
jgi:fructosamine-3-kinase